MERTETIGPTTYETAPTSLPGQTPEANAPSEAQGGVPSRTEEARRAAREAGEQVRERASEAVAQAREQGQAMFDDQKARLAHKVSDVGAALRQAADRLHEEEDHNLAQYSEMIADRVEGVADYLEHQDLGQLVDQASQLARRRPEVVLGGMFVAGMALGRFLKSSSPSRRESETVRPTTGLETTTSPSFAPACDVPGATAEPAETSTELPPISISQSHPK